MSASDALPETGSPAEPESEEDVIYVPPRSDGPSPEECANAANTNILDALLAAKQKRGKGAQALEDGDLRSLTYGDLVRAVAALSRLIRREVKADVVGVFLPSSAGAAVTFFAILAAGKTPAMLNFTAGQGPLLAACRAAQVGAILTANRFLTLANLEPVAKALEDAAPVMALEEMRQRISWTDKVFALLGPSLGLLASPKPDDTAAIVFTSGSEGDPKGVALTHRNFLANAHQIVASLPLDRVETFFNPLPIFHSYGLGPGLILPLVLGQRLVLHPSPLRAKEVAARIAATKANVLLATDTFLRQYARAGDPGSLASLEFAVCGAERVRHETRELVRSRFGFEVVEGYGVTETSPVLAANHPDDIRDGTVGRLLPGIEARLVRVEGLDNGRRLEVRGPNVMAGYIDPKSGAVEPPEDGWHNTGDVVAIEDGYLCIRGRLKRFAKIGGEMTSLAVVENLAGAVWPDSLHAAAAVPGKTRGEVIVLLTEQEAVDQAALHAQLKADGLPERFLPHKTFTVPSIPLMGTGKVDAVNVTRLATELMAEKG
ncbi:MAG: AMP-binding protein [Pseudomonadota bacterium]